MLITKDKLDRRKNSNHAVKKMKRTPRCATAGRRSERRNTTGALCMPCGSALLGWALYGKVRVDPEIRST